MQYELAAKGDRLWASILDFVCIYLPVILMKFAKQIASWTNNSEDDTAKLLDSSKSLAFKELSIEMTLVLLALALGGYTIYLLITKGQTIGKTWKKIKIVKVGTGENGGFVTNVLLRLIVIDVLNLIPFFIFVDVLLIFGKARRCAHDYIAGTIVVNE
jgi:uncharacterized RDD family membrane protein YckC